MAGFLGTDKSMAELAPKKKKQKDDIFVPPEVGIPEKRPGMIADRLAGGTGGAEPKTPSPEESLQAAVAKSDPKDTIKTMKDQISLAVKERAVTPHDEQSFMDRLDKLDKEYRDDKKRLGRAELAEKMTQSLIQMGAGLYGLKHGQDLSGVKFDKTDWNKKMDQTIQEFRTRQSQVEKARGESRTGAAEAARAEANRQARGTSRLGQEANLKLKIQEIAERKKANELAASEKADRESAKAKLKLDEESKVISTELDKALDTFSDKDKAHAASKIKNLRLTEADISEIIKANTNMLGNVDEEAVRNAVLNANRQKQTGTKEEAPPADDGASTYSAAQEAGIANVMKKNKLSREQAITALKKAKKL